MFKTHLKGGFDCVWWHRVDSYGKAARSRMDYVGTLHDGRNP